MAPGGLPLVFSDLKGQAKNAINYSSLPEIVKDSGDRANEVAESLLIRHLLGALPLAEGINLLL